MIGEPPACQNCPKTAKTFEVSISNSKIGCVSNSKSMDMLSIVNLPTAGELVPIDGHLMFIKDMKSHFKQFECGTCKRCFKKSKHLDMHIKTCDRTLIKHVWKGGVYEPKMNIKKRLEGFGIDTSKHNCLFPFLAVYDKEAFSPSRNIGASCQMDKNVC